ncbi:MAG: glycoside hydrolase family 65 protein, partial [Thermodesulfobacteriota bacterium]
MTLYCKRNKPIYPFEEWQLSENEYNEENNILSETLFTLGNGYIGLRGSFEEGFSGPDGNTNESSYINGFYESEPFTYGENKYGYAENNQRMLQVPNGKVIELFVGDEKFSLTSGKIIEYKRSLDFESALLRRDITWQSPAGKSVKLSVNRLVSFAEKHLFAIHYEVMSLNFSGKIIMKSAIEVNFKTQTGPDDPRLGSSESSNTLITLENNVNGEFGLFHHRTRNSDLHLVSAMDNSIEADCQYEQYSEQQERRVECKYIIDAKQGEAIKLTKYVVYYSSRDFSKSSLIKHAKTTLTKAKQQSFQELLSSQKKIMEQFWYKSDVIIRGDPPLQQAIRFNLFHLFQSVGRDGKTSIAAKGLTGDGYNGHYFWDAEIYVLPFFCYTEPEIARKLLEFRYSILDKARQRARMLSHNKGATFPWRTIGGEECSAYYPAGSAQYHLNADIVCAIKTYIEATDDMDLLCDLGAEIIFETARIWVDLGEYIAKKGHMFCINEVSGPDEYTTLVNNNFYTNVMAKMHLLYAWDTVKLLSQKYPKVYDQLKTKIGLDDEEPEQWRCAAENMYLPYDDELGIYPQDDSFLYKAIWNFKNTPHNKYPLMLHYHPMIIYRYQICKQADVLLALLLLGDQFPQEEIKKNFDYYEPITTHDSTLSPSIHSIVANEIGYHQLAYDY